MNHQITISKRTALSAALCLALGIATTTAQASWTGTFTMYDGAGGYVDNATDVTGVEKVSLASTTTFFGALWTAHNLTTYGPGTYTIDTIEAGNYVFTVGAGQIAGHMLFDWSTTANIDVINMWNVTTNADGSTQYESIDFDCGAGTDGIRGCGMIDGAFIGFNANFDMNAFTAFPVVYSSSQGGNPLVLVTIAGGNVTIRTNKTAADGYNFNWGASNGTLTGAAVGGTVSETFVFAAGGLTNSTAYTLSVTITKGADTVTATSSVTVEPAAALSGVTDTDGDGLVDNDVSEGYPDNDGDGIPNYLDPTNDSAALVAINSTDTDLGSMSASSGTVSLGATALANSITNMLASTAASGLAVTISDIGTSDSLVSSSCVGGCFDFKVTGLSEGGTSKVVVPVSTPLGDYPAYRKFSSGTWQGFKIDDDNSISSAAALNTNPVTCPAAGDSAYSSVGLTPGHSCIQLTIKDGGANDADSVANGVITDPGGVGTTGEHIMVADVPNGCSMSATPVNPTERADWWLVAGFLSVLALLRGLRRKDHAA